MDFHRLIAGSSIDDQTRSDLLAQWAQMYAAGVDPVRTMETLQAGSIQPVQRALDTVLKRVGAGGSPAMAWVQAGLLKDWQGELLEAGFSSGRGEWGLRSMAESLDARALRWRRFKGKMLFPLAVLVLAGFLFALPALIGDQIGFFGFIVRTLLPAALVLITVSAMVRALDAAEGGLATRLMLQFPLLGRWLELRTRADFLAVITQSLRAGIPARQAVELSARAVRPAELGSRFLLMVDLLDAGQPVAQAMQNNGVLEPDEYSLVDSGEQSGRLDEMLERVARGVDQAADDYADGVATWAPRLLYMGIAALMILSVLGFWGSYSPGV